MDDDASQVNANETPTETANDTVTRPEMNGPKAATNFIQVLGKNLPTVNHPMNILTLVQAIRKSYLRHTSQPSFKILQYKPSMWIIDKHPAASQERVLFSKFAPTMKLKKIKQKMYDEATFARRYMYLASFFGTILSTLMKRKDSKEFVWQDRYLRNEIFISFTPVQNKEVKLVFPSGQETLDPMNNVRIGVFVHLSGGGYAEFDVTSESLPVRLHKKAPEKEARLKNLNSCLSRHL